MRTGCRAASVAELDDAALDVMVASHPDGGLRFARLVEYGTPIWVLINRMGEPTPENIARVAWESSRPERPVQAALRYHERNKMEIETVIIINNEPFRLSE